MTCLALLALALVSAQSQTLCEQLGSSVPCSCRDTTFASPVCVSSCTLTTCTAAGDVALSSSLTFRLGLNSFPVLVVNGSLSLASALFVDVVSARGVLPSVVISPQHFRA